MTGYAISESCLEKASDAWVRTYYYGYSKQYAGFDLTPGQYGIIDCKDIVKIYQVSAE